MPNLNSLNNRQSQVLGVDWEARRLYWGLPMSFRAEQQTNKHKGRRGHGWLECSVSHMTRSTRPAMKLPVQRHDCTATGTFVKLLTDMKYYFAADFRKGAEKVRLKTHRDQVQAFFVLFLSVWAVNRPMCTWCETACVHFSLSHQWKETLPFYLNQQILTLTDGTTQTRFRFHVLL